MDETEKRIKNAAREIFLEKGREGARIQAIAEKAGVNKALVHYYFRSKDKLYLEVLKDIFREVLIRLMSIPENLSFRDFLREFITNHIDFLNKHRNLLSFILWELREDREEIRSFIEDTISSFDAPPRELFMKRMIKAIQNGEIRPVDPLHFMINLVSLDIFPFVSAPIIASIFSLSESDMELFLSKRRDEVFRLVWNDIKNEQ